VTFAPVQRHIAAWLREHPEAEARADRVVSFDVTNRKIDGCCYLFFGADGRSPRLVAKAARTAAGRAVFEIEHDNLRGLAARGMNAERPTVPTALGRWREGDTLITLQSALDGALLKNVPGPSLFAPAALGPTLDGVLGWWEHFQTRMGTREETLGDDAYAALVRAPVASFLRRYRTGTRVAALLEERFETRAALRGTRLPLMVRHGDFCAANMVLQPHGIGVFDWEFPLVHQTPLFDLFFFFASVRFPYSGRNGESSHFESFEAVYWGDSYFSRALRARLRRAAERFGVPAAALPDLLLLSLVQIANMKYEGLLVSHGLEELPTAASPEARLARWQSFEEPDKNAPFACIRDGSFENLRLVAERGLPEL
jgi:Ser/Thr protein kinase RdoA (MazF antagonist)